MSNPESVGLNEDYEPAVVEAVTTTAQIALALNKDYLLQHNGVDAAGSAATTRINMATDDSDPADTAGAGQLPLITGNIVKLGPGIDKLKFSATANAPTFSIIPGRDDQGRH